MWKQLLAFLISLWLVPTLGWALPLPRATGPQAPPEKKKTRKVWTNDDLQALQQSRGVSVVGQEPAAPVVEKPAQPAPPAATSAELEKLRGERENLQAMLEGQRKLLEDWTAERNATENPELRDTLDDDIEVKQKEIADLEAQIQKLDARLTELEKQAQAKPRKRRATKPATPPAAPPSSAPPR